MNNKRNLLIVVILLVVILFGCVGYYFYDGSNDNVVDNNYNNDENDSDVMQIVDINVGYSGDSINVYDYVEKFNQNSNNEGKLLNLIVNNIMINDKEYIFKLNKHPQNCLELVGNDIYTDEHNSFYINDTKIYHQNNQSCYLESVHLLTVIDNEYIGVSFRGQAGNYINLYDKNLAVVDTIEAISIDVVDGVIVVTDYDDDDKECIINTYAYSIVDGNIVRTLKEKGNESYCNQMTGEGCCS